MRAHCLQHVPFEGLGSIEPWLRAAGYQITYTRFFHSSRLPDIDALDLLIVMGGPMSINDEDTFPWLKQEKQFIREAVHCGTPVLGICLGAQLIAGAMGARIYPNSSREIGWFPVQTAMKKNDASFSMPAEIEVFHWHGETFDLPDGAIRLAESAVCANQAFQLGRSVIGLQFHLEVTPESVHEMVQHCRMELQPAQYVQDEDLILAAPTEKYRRINTLLDEVLHYLKKSTETAF
ncbi:MAG: gamma-glutamyl-gamma-aminobutyrate hydrolase family protein [Desulfopila sp.]|jgi:GMP synthase-like glutamine amidotransferase|nr:gamma-glutamyl-gamma-aminobutyrate hydrolase family protein [Desulfopila sp.]